MSAVAEFAVTLGVTTTSSALIPSLQFYCQQDIQCSYATASLTTNNNDVCLQSKFDNMTHFSENQFDLASGQVCNEIHLVDGTSLFDGISCATISDDDEPCPAVLYRYPDGRSQTAYCPTGTEMVITASGIPGSSQVYKFTPTSGAEFIGDLPDGCSLVGDEYQCDSGVATLRFTAAGELACNILDNGGNCPTPAFGIPYGQCGGTCESGPEIVTPPITDSFSVELKVTTSSSSLTPSLEWVCVQDFTSPETGSGCFITAPPQLATDCISSIFTNYTHYTEHLSDLATGTVCNEIVLQDNIGVYEGGSCSNSRNTLESSTCGGVLYRYQDGRNMISSCPSGTLMQLSVTGNPGDISYIIKPTSTTTVDLLNGYESIPAGCNYIANAYRCKPGTVKFEFIHRTKPCDPQSNTIDDDCPLPLLGYQYGSCGANNNVCSNGPNPTLVEPGDEFKVTLRVTSSSSAFIPSIEWYCRSELPCSYLAASLVDTCSATSNFDDLTEYNESPTNLFDNGCNRIILQDASGVFDENSCSVVSSEEGEEATSCGAVIFRYKDGRDKSAVCPTGSELVISAAGIPGIDYIFKPDDGVVLNDELPAGCVFVAGGYRYVLSFSVCADLSPRC